MYKIGDYIMYKREVCIIKSIKKNFLEGKDYYSISPIMDESLAINVPADSTSIKKCITKKEATTIISKIPSIQIVDITAKNLENTYKELLASDDFLDLIKIIKTTYLRNKTRALSGHKIGDRDDFYFKKAEKLLYTSLGVALNMSYDECREYVINKVQEKEEGLFEW